MSAADPANPVVMWQLATAGHHFIPKQYLVAHKLKFMRQNLDAQTGKTARDFAESIAAYQPNRVWGSPFFFKTEASGADVSPPATTMLSRWYGMVSAAASAVAATPAETSSSVASAVAATPVETSSSAAAAAETSSSAASALATSDNSCVATELPTNGGTTDPKLQKLLELNFPVPVEVLEYVLKAKGGNLHETIGVLLSNKAV